MVFQDVSVDSYSRIHRISSSSGGAKPLTIAPLNDRLLAVFLDFLIFSPLVGLWVSGIYRQIHLSSLLEVEEGIVGGFWILYILAIFSSIISIMTLFLYFWQATPGQKFLQLRVVSYPSVDFERRLTIDRCILRSFLWCLSWILLGLPFLEVISHPLRRAFHERASDTLVVSLKRLKEQATLELESTFIRNFLRTSFVLLAMMICGLGFKAYDELSEEVESSQTAGPGDNPECAISVSENDEKLNPIDLLMTLAYTKQLDEDCLNTQLDSLFLKAKRESVSFAYLAKSMIIQDEKEKKKYLDRACSESKKQEKTISKSKDDAEICNIATFLASKPGSRKMEIRASNPLLLSRVLLLESYMEQKDYIPALATVKELDHFVSLKHFLETKYVAAVWSLRKADEDANTRKPASKDGNMEGIFKEFEERYLKQ